MQSGAALRGALFLAAIWIPGVGLAATPITTSTTTAAALSDQASLCSPGTGQYPPQRTWRAARTFRKARSATTADNLQPKVEQHRMLNGVDTIVATYTTIGGTDDCYGYNMNQPGSFLPQCGPFPRGPYRTWLPGDVYEVYPAVYSGAANNPWFGPQVDTYDEYIGSAATPPTFIPFIPTGLVIQGVVQNGIRPTIELLAGQGASLTTYNQSAAFFGPSSGIVWDNIDVVAAPGYAGAKAGIYIAGANNLTISNTRVIGFHDPDAMGIFGAEADTAPGANDNNSGTLALIGDELGFNGGVTSAANHNAYIGGSATDPNFQVVIRNMWSHDAFFGHTMKIRAQVADVEGSYFEGSLPQDGFSQAETYLLDYPSGGRLTVKNNIFVKNASGGNSNGISLTYGMEGIVDSRPLSIDYENNTFVAFAEYFDGFHPLFPMAFLYPSLVPGVTGFPVASVTVKNNAFVGYCPQNNATQDYRGDLSATEGFGELSLNYRLAQKFRPAGGRSPNVGAPAYKHVTQPGLFRATSVIGAED